VLRGMLTAEVVVPCARCLEPARIAVHEPLSALFVPRSGLPGVRARGEDRAEEAALGEADVVPYDGETVVMDGLVRDEILLAIPMIPLCSEGCAGIRLAAPGEE